MNGLEALLWLELLLQESNSELCGTENLSAPKSQRVLRFAIAMPIADPRNLSAAPQQSEICVKFSVFHTVFDVKFW